MGFLNFVFRYSTVNILVGLVLSFHGFLLVQSQDQTQPQLPPPLWPPFENISPPVFFELGNTPPPPPPPPPLNSPPPPPPPPPPQQSPPPPQQSPPPPQLSPPQASVGIMTPPSPSLLPPLQPPNPSPHQLTPASPPLSNRNQPRRLQPPSPPPPRTFDHSEKRGLNIGKTVGLVFAAVAAILQICVVAFLIFKRKQLLRMTHTY